MKKRVIILGISLVVVIGIIVGVSYAFFSTGGMQEQANTFTSGCLNISLTDASSSISLSNIYPVTDVEGLEGTSYDFTITNTCNTSTNYQINLESINQASNSLDADYVKVSLSSDTVDNVISILSDNTSVTPEIDGAYESYNLYTGTLGASETKPYHLKLWLDYDATVEQAANKVYQSKINVIANPEIQVVDNLEATFNINLDNDYVGVRLTENVTSVKYCVTDSNQCNPDKEVEGGNSISFTLYNPDSFDEGVDLIDTKTVNTALGKIEYYNPNPVSVCIRLNDSSNIICSNPEKLWEPDFTRSVCARYGANDYCNGYTNGIFAENTNKGTTYYYRGVVENNYLEFAGFYWRIIRINEDGSIRVIYNGIKSEVDAAGKEEVLANGYDDDGQYTSIGNYGYNMPAPHPPGPTTQIDVNTRSEGVGFTYELGYQRPLSSSGTNSDVKTRLEDWYNDNLYAYDNLIVSEAGFCNDRNTVSDATWVSSGSSFYYAAYERFNNLAPTFECNNTNDLYQTKIGLITADEIVYAGAGLGERNDNFYLYTGQNYWTMTPSAYTNSSAQVYAFLDEFYFGEDYNVTTLSDIRPVINISKEATITGSGTIQDPYVVQTA